MKKEKTLNDLLFCATDERVHIDSSLLSFDYWLSSVDTIFLKLRAHADENAGSALSELIYMFLCVLEQKNETIEPFSINGKRHAFVVLSHALKVNGEMSDVLLERLFDALQNYKKRPQSTLILSGLGPLSRNAKHSSEARCMQQWLLQQGVPGECIVQENTSTDTVQNVLYSTQLLVELGFSTATIITSPSHLTRAVTLFQTHVVQRELANKIIITNVLNKEDLDAQTLQEKLWMLKDLGRILGIWKY